MNNQRWLESLRAELARTDLPNAYRARLYCELEEHLADLMEENEMSAENMAADVIGSPQELARAAVHAQRPRVWRVVASFLVNFVVFGLLPVPLMVLAIAVFVLGIDLFASGLQWALQASFDDFEPFVIGEHQELTKFVLLTSIVMIASGVVVGEAWLARKIRAKGAWLLLASVTLSLVIALMFLDIRYTGIAGQNQLTLGLMLFSSPSNYSLVQLAKGLVPLAIGIWMIKNSTTAHLAPSVSA